MGLDAGGAIVPLAAEAHHLFGQIQGGGIVGSEQVVHPLATDDEQQLGLVAHPFTRGPSARVDVVDTGGRVAASRPAATHRGG